MQRVGGERLLHHRVVRRIAAPVELAEVQVVVHVQLAEIRARHERIALADEIRADFESLRLFDRFALFTHAGKICRSVRSVKAFVNLVMLRRTPADLHRPRLQHPDRMRDQDDKTKFRAGFSVPADAPPAFFVVAHDDKNTISSSGSALLCLEYKKLNLPAKLHIYAKGGHGSGMCSGLPTAEWLVRVGEWLDSRGWLKE